MTSVIFKARLGLSRLCSLGKSHASYFTCAVTKIARARFVPVHLCPTAERQRFVATKLAHRQSHSHYRRLTKLGCGTLPLSVSRFNSGVSSPSAPSANIPQFQRRNFCGTSHLPSKIQGNTESSSTTSGDFSLPLLLFLAVFAISQEPDEEEADRINALLNKSPSLRTTDESIELFNYLVRKGREEARKAKNKDIVIFLGNMGAGKSTLINFLHGCQMTKNRDGEIVVDPQSKKQPVTEIGVHPISHTAIPKNISDISHKFPSMESSQLGPEAVLTPYDMPGLSDSRGIEVALASAIAMKEVCTSAKSVRLVMVFEHGQLNAERGAKWKECVHLLAERFGNISWNGEKNLCLVFTKTHEDIDKIKKDIQRYITTTSIPVDLSECAIVYDPLNPNDRDRILSAVFATKAFKGLGIKISINHDQLWQAQSLGEKIADGVTEHLESDQAETAKAIEKVRFTWGLSRLGNKGLNMPYLTAAGAVVSYAEKIVLRMDGRVLQSQVREFRNYRHVRDSFAGLVKFEKLDKETRRIIENIQDPRWCRWENFRFTAGSSALTLAALGLGVPALAGVFGAFGMFSLARWEWPTSEDQAFAYIGEFLESLNRPSADASVDLERQSSD